MKKIKEILISLYISLKNYYRKIVVFVFGFFSEYKINNKLLNILNNNNIKLPKTLTKYDIQEIEKIHDIAKLYRKKNISSYFKIYKKLATEENIFPLNDILSLLDLKNYNKNLKNLHYLNNLIFIETIGFKYKRIKKKLKGTLIVCSNKKIFNLFKKYLMILKYLKLLDSYLDLNNDFIYEYTFDEFQIYILQFGYLNNRKDFSELTYFKDFNALVNKELIENKKYIKYGFKDENDYFNAIIKFFLVGKNMEQIIEN